MAPNAAVKEITPEVIDQNNMGGASVPSSISDDWMELLAGTDIDLNATITKSQAEARKGGRKGGVRDSKLDKRDMELLTAVVANLNNGQASSGYLVLSLNGDFPTKKRQIDNWVKSHVNAGIVLKTHGAKDDQYGSYTKNAISPHAAAPATDENKTNKLLYDVVFEVVTPETASE